MSRILMDFLLESPLLDEDLIDVDYAEFGDDRLEAELNLYRSWVLENAAVIAEDVRGRPRDLAAFFGPTAGVGLAEDPIPTLRRSALYFDRAVLDDPLFALTSPLPEGAAAMSRFHGHPDPTGPHRRAIARAARQIRAISPLIGVDFLKLAPLSFEHEPPSHVPLFMDGMPMPEAIPESVRDWLHDKAQVANAFLLEDGAWASSADPLSIGRAITVGFPEYSGMMLFHLAPTKVKRTDESAGTIDLHMWNTLDPPSQEHFNAWVSQSVGSFSARTVREVATDVIHAASTGAMYITTSPFLADLLSQGSDPDVDSQIASLAMNLELPFLDGIGTDVIARIRDDEPTAFAAYREHLQANLIDLRGESDSRSVERRLEEIAFEMRSVQIPAVNREVRRLRQNLAVSAGIGAASLATLAPTSGASLVSLLVAVAHGIQSAVEYKQSLMNNPAYFLWKVTRDAG